MKQITITIEPDGTPTVETRGFDGPACESETRDLELALGAPGKTHRTPEYFHRTTIAKNQESGQ